MTSTEIHSRMLAAPAFFGSHGCLESGCQNGEGVFKLLICASFFSRFLSILALTGWSKRPRWFHLVVGVGISKKWLIKEVSVEVKRHTKLFVKIFCYFAAVRDSALLVCLRAVSRRESHYLIPIRYSYPPRAHCTALANTLGQSQLDVYKNSNPRILFNGIYH